MLRRSSSNRPSYALVVCALMFINFLFWAFTVQMGEMSFSTRRNVGETRTLALKDLLDSRINIQIVHKGSLNFVETTEVDSAQ